MFLMGIAHFISLAMAAEKVCDSAQALNSRGIRESQQCKKARLKAIPH
jgi:hypothetical protein